MIRTTAFIKEGITAEDFMIRLPGLSCFDDLDADLFIFGDWSQDQPDGTVSWVSMTALDGIDVYWLLVGEGLLHSDRSQRQTVEDISQYFPADA